MIGPRRNLLAALAITVCAPHFATAQQVITDDLVVQGRACVGFDCLSSVPAGTDPLVLTENNLRVSFDTPSTNFRLTANEAGTGGDNAFRIDTKIETSGAAGATLLDGSVVQGTVESDGRLLITDPPIIADGQLSPDTDPNADLTEVSVTVDNADIVGTYIAAGAFTNSIFTNSTNSYYEVDGDQTLQNGDGTTAQISQTASAAVSNFTLSATTGSVAVGRNSVATANTVSIGSSAEQRRLTGVAAPVDANDAVPLGYLQKAIGTQPRAQAAQLSSLTGRSRDVNAMSAALSALQWNPRNASDTQVALGVGHYDSQSAIAFGILLRPSSAVTVRAGYATAGRDDPQFNLSSTFRW